MTNFPLNLTSEQIVDHYVTIKSHMIIQDCIFDGCIVYWPTGATHVKLMYNLFHHCDLRGDGWPKPLMDLST